MSRWQQLQKPLRLATLTALSVATVLCFAWWLSETAALERAIGFVTTVSALLTALSSE